MNHTANNNTLANPEHAMPDISAVNPFHVIPAEQSFNPMLNHREAASNCENIVESDYISPGNTSSVLINHQQMTYGDGLSLSGASVCSSMDIRTPDIHPVYSNGNSIPAGEMVGQAIATQSTFRDQLVSPTTSNAPIYQWHQPQDASMMWTSSTADASVDPSMDLSYPPSIHSEENDESSSNSCLSEIEEKMVLYCNSPRLLVETNEEGLSSSSMRKSPNNRRNTVSSFPCTDEWCDPTEKELRRQSMNSFLIKPRVKLEEQQEKEESNTLFCHLSREELIQRVVQLEREKQLNSKLSGSTAATAAASSDKEGPNSPRNAHLTADGSDEDEVHPCRWFGCDTSATSLDQLIVHIKEAHVGSGKAAYFCEWESCPRERKPFLKRHKMQNHMRTHTGERPFECHVEGCDKRFSRPDSLNTHVKTHSSIRPFACLYENCSKAYFHSRSLRKHTKSHESAAAASNVAVPTAAAAILAPARNTTIATNTAEVDIKEEDVIVHRQHPYDRSLKPTRYYRQQTSLCGSEARQQQQTPSHRVMESANFAPMMINTALLQQQTQQQQVYGNATKMMEVCEPVPQEQQIFAAGSAYNDDYNSHVVEQQLFQHHQRLQQQQLLNYQQQQQQQLSYQNPQHPQAYVSYNNQPLSVQLHVQQQQPSYHGYNYTIY